MEYPGILSGNKYSKNINFFGSDCNDAKLFKLAFTLINKISYSARETFNAGICDKQSYQLRIK
jgi:hypothetical protein